MASKINLSPKVASVAVLSKGGGSAVVYMGFISVWFLFWDSR